MVYLVVYDGLEMRHILHVAFSYYSVFMGVEGHKLVKRNDICANWILLESGSGHFASQ